MIGSMQESVSNNDLNTWLVNKLEGKFREIKHSSGLMRVKLLGLLVVDKILMVTKDKSREIESLKIMSIFL